jgi:four helix bundle protein
MGAYFQQWLTEVPDTLRSDPLWAVEAYRLATFVADVAWPDVERLAQDRRTRTLADQLYRSVGSIGANIAEGYSRASGREKARFYEYALGSAREARDWYYKSRHVIGERSTEQMDLLSQIARLLFTMVRDQRRNAVAEPPQEYGLSPDQDP